MGKKTKDQIKQLNIEINCLREHADNCDKIADSDSDFAESAQIDGEHTRGLIYDLVVKRGVLSEILQVEIAYDSL